MEDNNYIYDTLEMLSNFKSIYIDESNRKKFQSKSSFYWPILQSIVKEIHQSAVFIQAIKTKN